MLLKIVLFIFRYEIFRCAAAQDVPLWAVLFHTNSSLFDLLGSVTTAPLMTWVGFSWMLLLTLRLLISNGFLQKLWILIFTVWWTLLLLCFVYVPLVFSWCSYGFYRWISSMFCCHFLLRFIQESLHALYCTAGKGCIKPTFGQFIILVNGCFSWGLTQLWLTEITAWSGEGSLFVSKSGFTKRCPWSYKVLVGTGQPIAFHSPGKVWSTLVVVMSCIPALPTIWVYFKTINGLHCLDT